MKVEVQEKLALKIDQFNKLMDEQRYAEAQVVAKQAAELDPNNPVVVQVALAAEVRQPLPGEQGRRKTRRNRDSSTRWAMCDKAAIPFDDNNPMVFANDVKEWEGLQQAPQQVRRRRQAAAFGAGDRDREEAAHAGLAAIHQCPAEQGDGLSGQAGAR